MNHQNEVLASVIEHLGIPLLSAVAHVNKTAKKASAEKEAQIAARLLSASVKLGMGLSAKMNMVSDPDEAEALRFRLTALSAHLISDHISQTQKDVSEEQLEGIKAALDSVLSFSSHFSISTEGVNYLEKMDLAALGSREALDLRTLEAILPLVMTVSDKPLSQSPATLIQDMAERLMRETRAFYERLSTEDRRERGIKEILTQQIFKLLVSCLNAAYRAETLLPQPSLAHVWEEFDRTKGLSLVLCDYLVTGQKRIDTTDEERAPAVAAPLAAQEEAPVVAVPPPVQIVEDAPQEAPPVPPVFPAKPAGDSGSPMSFFRKRD